MNKQAKYHESHPWVKYVCWARRRCSGRDPRWAKFYSDKGIKAFITSEDTKRILFRDMAFELSRPSLDRICPKFGYVPWNIRFIEFADNVRMGREAMRK